MHKQKQQEQGELQFKERSDRRKLDNCELPDGWGWLPYRYSTTPKPCPCKPLRTALRVASDPPAASASTPHVLHSDLKYLIYLVFLKQHFHPQVFHDLFIRVDIFSLRWGTHFKSAAAVKKVRRMALSMQGRQI